MPKSRQPLTAPTYPSGAPHGSGVLASGSFIGTHRHAEGQLIYPAAGAVATTTERGTWVAPANRLTWTPPGFEHSHRVYGTTDVRIIVIPVELCGKLAGQPGVYSVNALLREAILALTDRLGVAGDVYERLRAVVIDELVQTPDKSLHLPEPRDDRLRRVTEMLLDDPGRPATLAELGRAVGASERTLSRLFHIEFGMTFHQWRTVLRIHHALVHLAEGRSVTDTAVECGWSNPTSFIEAFTAIVGQTPGRYKADLGNETARTVTGRP